MATTRYDDLHFPADHLSVEGASHWGLVLNRRVLAGMASAVTDWLEKRSRVGAARFAGGANDGRAAGCSCR
jgi:hypothetical protein